MRLIIIKFIASRPLKPSIRLDPFITNKKHNNTKIEENKWFDIKGSKNGISMLKIFMGKIYVNKKIKKIINNNRVIGLTFIFKSSKKPIRKAEKLIKI